MFTWRLRIFSLQVCMTLPLTGVTQNLQQHHVRSHMSGVNTVSRLLSLTLIIKRECLIKSVLLSGFTGCRKIINIIYIIQIFANTAAVLCNILYLIKANLTLFTFIKHIPEYNRKYIPQCTALDVTCFQWRREPFQWQKWNCQTVMEIVLFADAFRVQLCHFQQLFY